MKRIIWALVAMGGLVGAGYAAGANARTERADRFFEMLSVIDRSANDLAWVGNRAQQFKTRKGQ